MKSQLDMGSLSRVISRFLMSVRNCAYHQEQTDIITWRFITRRTLNTGGIYMIRILTSFSAPLQPHPALPSLLPILRIPSMSIHLPLSSRIPILSTIVLSLLMMRRIRMLALLVSRVVLSLV